MEMLTSNFDESSLLIENLSNSSIKNYNNNYN